VLWGIAPARSTLSETDCGLNLGERLPEMVRVSPGALPGVDLMLA
jgi:hypothetical protein